MDNRWSQLSMKENEEYKWSVYKHTSPSGKIYIGITSRDPKLRWGYGYKYKEQTYFYRAIKKYGWNNIQHEVLYSNLTRGQAITLEQGLIHYYRSNNNKFGYNITSGGEGLTGMKLSEETKAKISKAHMGMPGYHLHQSEESRRKISLANKGKKRSEECRRQMSLSRRGQKAKPSTIERLRQANYKPVVCIETNVEYKSIKEASELTGIKYEKIAQCCRKTIKTANGLHWRFKSDENYVIPKDKNKVCVYCIELDKTFPSIKEASLETGISTRCISNAICGWSTMAGGLHWERRSYEQ